MVFNVGWAQNGAQPGMLVPPSAVGPNYRKTYLLTLLHFLSHNCRGEDPLWNGIYSAMNLAMIFSASEAISRSSRSRQLEPSRIVLQSRQWPIHSRSRSCQTFRRYEGVRNAGIEFVIWLGSLFVITSQVTSEQACRILCACDGFANVFAGQVQDTQLSLYFGDGLDAPVSLCVRFRVQRQPL
jgi:hypothetical protein